MKDPPVTVSAVGRDARNLTLAAARRLGSDQHPTVGPFVIRELARGPYGQVVEITARRHRKGHAPIPTTGVAGPATPARPQPRAVVWAPREMG